MPAYISLLNWTEQGVKSVRETVNRGRAVEKKLEAMGGHKIGLWWTMGQYDAVFVFEAPNEEAAMHLLLGVGMQGNVRTTTLRCFSEEEMAAMLQNLPR